MRWLPPATLALLLFVSACSGGQSRSTPAGTDDGTGFPRGYAQWTKLNAAPLYLESEKAARNLFANTTALAHRGGGPYPLGSVLVKEERSLEADPQGRLRVGDVFRVSLMVKVGKGDTSGWAFRAYDPETRREFPRDRVDPDGCYFCHADAQARDYVFTKIGQ
jgi:hypothetical protein